MSGPCIVQTEKSARIKTLGGTRYRTTEQKFDTSLVQIRGYVYLCLKSINISIIICIIIPYHIGTGDVSKRVAALTKFTLIFIPIWIIWISSVHSYNEFNHCDMREELFRKCIVRIQKLSSRWSQLNIRITLVMTRVQRLISARVCLLQSPGIWRGKSHNVQRFFYNVYFRVDTVWMGTPITILLSDFWNVIK